MLNFIKHILVLIPTVLVLDFLWLGVLASKFYKSELAGMIRKQGEGLDPIWWAAGLVYVFIVVGLAVFVVPKALTLPLLQAFFLGALFGAVLYGVYDFTNYSLLQGFPLKVALVDLVWGSVLGGISTLVAVLFKNFYS